MNSDVTVVVSSCDKYEDAWEPFFRLYHIMGADKATENPVVLNTETKKYDCDFMKVVTVNSKPNLTWSQRMMNVLENIDTEFIFLLLEDFFIQKPFKVEYFNMVLEHMRSNTDVGVVHLSPNGRMDNLPDDMFIDRNFETLNITMTAVIWRRTYLLKILRKHENPWQFEWYAGIRAKKYPEKVVQYNEKYPEIYSYTIALNKGYGISQGKWLPKNKELFDMYGIDVDFSSLGICNDYDGTDIIVPFIRANKYHNDKTVKGYVMRTYLFFCNKISTYKSLR